MSFDRRRLKPLYLFAVALNTVALVYAVESGQPLLAGAFVFALLYVGYRYRTVPDE